jgi:heat shock protein HtpX
VGVRLATTRNLLRLWLMLAVFAAPPTLVGAVVLGWNAAILFLFVAVLIEATVYVYCDRFLLAMLGARELVVAERPGLHSSLERLAAAARVVKPRLYFIPDNYPRSFSVGRSPTASTVVLSFGLLSVASPAEIEGLVAHELAHIRNRDVAVQTTSVAIAAAVVELTRIGGYVERGLLFLLAPVAAVIEKIALSPRRELAADSNAAALCGSPHGLADALVRLAHASELVSFGASPTTEPLYPINPFAGGDRLARMFDTHPSFPKRLRRLRELDPHWHEKLLAPPQR